MVSYQSENTPFPKIKRRQTTSWLRQVAATYGMTIGDVAYIFCDDTKILEVNRESAKLWKMQKIKLFLLKNYKFLHFFFVRKGNYCTFACEKKFSLIFLFNTNKKNN